MQQLEHRIVLASDLLSELQSLAGHAAGTVQPGEVTVGSANDPMLDIASPTLTFDGAGNVTISGDATLFPDETKFTATVTTLTGSYNYNSGSLSISAASAEFKVGSILDVSVTTPLFTHNSGTWSFSDTNATASSPEFAPSATASVTNLAITDSGISFGEADVKNSDFKLGNALEVTDFGLDVKGFTYTAATGTASATLSAASAGITAGSASLFPGQNAFKATVKNFNGGYDFSNGDLTLQADSVDVGVGNILDLTASNPSFSLDGNGDFTVTLPPGTGTPSATATSPDFPGASATVNGLAISNDGISFADAELTAPTVTIGNALKIDTFALDVQGFSYNANAGSGNGLSATSATISAGTVSLFPTETAFTATVKNFNGGYDFSNGDLTLQADSVDLSMGNILDLTATNPSFSLDGNGDFTVSLPAPTATGTATPTPSAIATSPDFPGASASVSGLTISNSGISFQEADLKAASVPLGNVLTVTNLEFDVKGFAYTAAVPATSTTSAVSSSLSATSAAISADKVDLNAGNGAVKGTVTGFGGSYNFSNKNLSLSATDVNFAISDVLTVDAKQFTFQLDPFEITALTADAQSPRFNGIEGTVDNLAIDSDGFSFADATLGASGTVSLGSAFTFTGLQFTLTNFGYSISHGASFGVFDDGDSDGDGNSGGDGDGDGDGVFHESVFKVTATSAALNIGSAFTASATGINGSVDLSSDDFTFSADTVHIGVGSYLNLTANQISFDPGATGTTDIADFGSIDAKLNVGNLSIDGSAKNFGISSSGKFVTQDGFGVSFSVGASSDSVSGAMKWPSWLPIQISELALNWPNFAADPTDFTIDLSASVNITGLGGTDVNLSGFVDNAVIDVGLLSQKEFPLVGLGGVGIAASGTLFGATIKGQFFMATLQEDGSGAVIPDGNPNHQTVATSVLYGGIDASMDMGGESGFEVRLGLSKLGPLQAYVSVADTQIIEPISGLALTNFAAGIQFDSTLPEITDPRQMANEPDLVPSSRLTLLQWKSNLQQAVENQVANAQKGASIWDQMLQPMTLEGGVTLFDAYATDGAFALNGAFKFDTVGHFFAQGDLTLGGSLDVPVDLYFDASKLAQGTGSILVLVKAPQQTPLMTVYGKLNFDFGGQSVNQGSITSPVDSQLGTAIELNGSSQYATAANIDLNQTSFTAELWAQRQDSGKAETLLAEDNGLTLGFDTNDNLTVAYGGTDILSYATTPDKQWHHYAVSFDASSDALILYVDGTDVKEGTIPAASLGAAATALYMGSQAGGGGGYFNGSLDEVRIWNVVRSASDIAGNMDAPITDTTALAQMLGYWQFDEGSGTTAADSSPGGNTAQLVGSPLWAGKPGTISSFNLSIDGGVDMTAASVGGVHVVGTADFSVAAGMTAIDMDITGSMGLDGITSAGSLLTVSGAADLDLNGSTPEFWGAFQLSTGDLSELQKLGIDAAGSAMFRFNTDSASHTINLPDANNPQAPPTPVTVPQASMQLYINGSADFKQGGNDWFQIQGTLLADFQADGSTTTDATDGQGNTLYTGLKAGTAVALNGTSQYVSAPNIDLNQTSFTVELWAQRQDSGRAQSLVSESNGLALGFDASDHLTFTYDGVTVTSSTPVADKLWHEYAVSFDKSNGAISLYFDGVKVGTGTIASSPGTVGTTLYMGSDAGGGSGYFNGSIDEARVWNVVRSAGDIANTMDAPITDPTLLAQMLGYWQFEDGSGTTAADSSLNANGPNGNTAQLVGSPQWIQDKGNPVEKTTDTFILDTLVAGTLSIGPAASPSATFTINGFMQIDDAGVAAEIDVTLPKLATSSITVSGNLFLELNTTGQEVTYTIPAGLNVTLAESSNGSVDIPAGPTDANGNVGTAGPYLIINGNGDLTIEKNYDLNGKFDLLVSSTQVSADVNANLTLGSLGTLAASGSIDLSSAGVVGVLGMSVAQGGSLGGTGFSIKNADFELAVNTTGSKETVTGFTVDPTTGNVTTNQQITLAPQTVEVIIGGDLSLTNNFDVKGELDLTESSGSVRAVVNASVDAGSIGTLTFAGSLNVSSAGVVGVVGLSLSSSKSLSASGFSINNADFQLAANTTGRRANVNGFTVDHSTGAITPNQSFSLNAGAVEVVAAGDLSFKDSFDVKGEFDFQESSGSWTINAQAAVKVPDLGTLNLSGSLNVDSTGLDGYLALGTGTQVLSPGGGFSLSGTFALEANTHTSGPAVPINGDSLSPGTVEVKANGDLMAGGFDLSLNDFFVRLSSGSVTVSITNATVAVGSVGTITVSGSLTIGDENGTSAGVYGELTASGSSSLSPLGGNFSITGTTEIQLNTTDATVTVGGQSDTLDADTVRVHVVGSAQLQKSGTNSFLISGTLDLTAQPTFVSVAVTNATVSLGGLGDVSVSGDLNASSDGMWGDLTIGTRTLPNAKGFSVFAAMQLEANTTGNPQTALVQPIDPATGDLGSATETTLNPNTIEVAIGGSLTITNSFTLAGELDLTMNNTGVHAALNANVSIFNVPLIVSGSVDVRGATSNAPGSIDGSLSVTAGGSGTLSLAGGAFTISAGATFTFDTMTHSASFSLHAPNGDINSSATVSFLGISASGNLTMTYNDGLATINVPDLAIKVPDFVQQAGAKLMEKLTLGTSDGPFHSGATTTIHVGGFLQSDGQFKLTVSGGNSPTSAQSYNMNGNAGGDGGFALTIGNFTGSVITGYNVSVSGSSYTVTPQYSDGGSSFTGFSAAVWAIGWAPVVGHATVSGGVTIASNQFDFNLGASIDGSSVDLSFTTGNPSSSGWTTPPVIQAFSPSGQFGPTTRVFSPPAGSIAKLGPPILTVDQGTTVAPYVSADVPGGTVSVPVGNPFNPTWETVDQHPLTFSDQVFDPNGNLVSSSQPQSAANNQFTAPSFTPEVPGAYKVVVTAKDSASPLSTSQTAYLLVNDVPPAGASITMPGSSPLGQSVTASVSYPINLPAVRAGETYTNAWTVSQHGSVVASGSSDTVNTFTFMPAATGDYTVTVVVSDNYGGSTTVSEPLSIVDPTAGLSFAVSGSTPQNKSVTFVVTGGGAGLSYSYDLLNNGHFEVSDSSNASISQAFSQPGTYVAHVRVSAPFGTNPDGIVSDYYTAPFVITDVAPKISNLNLRSNGMVGGLLAANIFYTSKNKTTVSWTVSPDTFTQFNNNGTNIDFVPEKAGVYSVTAEVADQYGGTATITKSMVVSPPNSPPALNNDGPDAQASAATVFFTGSGTGSTYSFDFLNDGKFTDPGDVANSSTAFATYTFDTPGAYTVHGQIKTSSGAVSDYFTTVTISDMPPSNVAISMPANLYLGGSATASATFDNPANNNETVAWTVSSASGSQVASGSGASFAFTPVTAGTYTINATVSDSFGGSASQSAKLIVTDPTVGLTLAGATPFNEGAPSTVTFSGGNPDANLRYSFDFLNDGSFSDARGDKASSTIGNASHTYAEEGTYVVHGQVSAPGNVHTDYYATLTVSDPAVQVQPVAVQGTEGAATGLVAVATFSDPGGAEKVSDYSATIDWGDGNTAAGTIIADGGGTFSVKGNHTYVNADSYALHVTVNHDQAPAASAQAAATIAVVPLPVPNLADDNAPATPDGSGPLTLRDAVNMFNAKGGLNEIDLAAGTYALTQATIPSAPVGTSGSLVVSNEDLTIRGAGVGQTIIDAKSLGDRVFDVLASGSLHLIGVTITGGNPTKDGAGGNTLDTAGGGVRNQGTLTLDHVDVKGNVAASGGGVESFNGSTTISNSTIQFNSALFGGGGLNGVGGNIQIINSDASDNKAATGGAVNRLGGQFNATGDSFTNNSATNGGAIEFDPLSGDSNPNTIAFSTFSGNFAAQSGGAIDNATTNGLALTDSTFAANQAGTGGAINNTGALLVTGGTFSGNLSRTVAGGAIANTSTGATQMIDTIVAHGSAEDLSGRINASYSLIQKPPASGLTADSHSLLNVNPLLAKLGNYGGPTQTMALLPGSPAINAGTSTGAPQTDQRGQPRSAGNAVDMGAFESGGFMLAATGGNDQFAPLNTAFAAALVVTVTPVNSQEPVAGGQISFSAPASGAGAALSAGTVNVAADGTASVTASSNSVVGHYAVTANMTGAVSSAPFSLTNNDTAPGVTSAGPYLVGTEGTLLLSARVFDPDPGQTITVKWDLNGDGTPDAVATALSNGSTVNVLATMSNAAVASLGLFNGLGTFTGFLHLVTSKHFTVSVTANDGFLTSAPATTTLTTEIGPEGGLKNDGPVIAGAPVNAQIFVPPGATAPGPLHFSIALDQNDLATTYADAGTNDTESFTFATPGPYTIYGRMFQTDGAFSDYTTTVDVYAAGQQEQIFVDRAYSDLLGRASSPYGPDSSSSNYWAAKLDNGVSRQDVASAILSSDEYDNNLVQSAFQQYLHRAADPQALDYFVPALQAGLTVEQLDIDLVSSAEYLNSRGGGTNDGFLDALFEDALGRSVDSRARAAFDAMFSGGVSRAQVADMVFGSTEYEDRLVENMFESLLNRPADPSALDFFTAELSSGMTDQQVMAQIIGSEEFAPLA